MNNLMIFDGRKVEVFEYEGKVLFNPKDVAVCLDIADVNSSIRNFSDKQVVKLKNSNMHDMHFRKLHNTGENFLTESGVYKLIFKSHKEEAEKFQDWVTDEVLPQIRQTGGYIQTNEDDDDATIMAKALLISQKTIEKKDNKIKALEKETLKLVDVIESQKPKLEYLDQILSCEDALLMTSIAFDYGLSAQALNKILAEERVQRNVRGQWILYSDYLGKGYTKTETNEFGGKPRVQTLWTQKGRMLIHEILTKREVKAMMDLELAEA